MVYFRVTPWSTCLVPSPLVSFSEFPFFLVYLVDLSALPSCFSSLLCCYEYLSIIFHICSVLKFSNDYTHTKNLNILWDWKKKKKKSVPIFFGCRFFSSKNSLFLFYLPLQFLLALLYVSVNYYQRCLRLWPWINRIWVPNLKRSYKKAEKAAVLCTFYENKQINK